ncbi:MAG: ATP-binding protein [Nitrospinota bacterium]|nr:ATP-binding protein [Nitrospinota bacterium]
MPKLRVKSQKGKAGEWIIQVEQNGIGLDEKHISKIFMPFERLHGRSLYEGTGMGLAICQKIADRHKRTITAASQVDVGTTFSIILPEKQPQF